MENEKRLNDVLSAFGMKVIPQYSEISGFDRWNVEIIVTLSPSTWFVQSVGSISKELDTFAVNPDGPRTAKQCEEIVKALSEEFGKFIDQIDQMTSQGGR